MDLYVPERIIFKKNCFRTLGFLPGQDANDIPSETSFAYSILSMLLPITLFPNLQIFYLEVGKIGILIISHLLLYPHSQDEGEKDIAIFFYNHALIYVNRSDSRESVSPPSRTLPSSESSLQLAACFSKHNRSQRGYLGKVKHLAQEKVDYTYESTAVRFTRDIVPINFSVNTSHLLI